jgi:threonine/homoserine/homoserine lactone efflux protein
MGGLILIGVGILMACKKTRGKKIHHIRKGLIGAYASAFLLMLANPTPILVFGAVFTALGGHRWEGAPLSTILFVTGVFLGSVSWSPLWVMLVSVKRSYFSSSHLHLLNRVTGAMITGFGALFLVMALIG